MKERFVDREDLKLHFLLAISEIIANIIPIAVIWHYSVNNNIYSFSVIAYCIFAFSIIAYKTTSLLVFLSSLDKYQYIEKGICLNLVMIIISIINMI